MSRLFSSRQVTAMVHIPKIHGFFVPTGVVILLLLLVQGSGNASQISAQVNALTEADNIYTIQYNHGLSVQPRPTVQDRPRRWRGDATHYSRRLGLDQLF